jgi:hypothetical protein
MPLLLTSKMFKDCALPLFYHTIVISNHRQYDCLHRNPNLQSYSLIKVLRFKKMPSDLYRSNSEWEEEHRKSVNHLQSRLRSFNVPVRSHEASPTPAGLARPLATVERPPIQLELLSREDRRGNCTDRDWLDL